MAEVITSYSAQYIERMLECAICMERFRSPKLLPCQHTFCKSCLSGLVETKRNALRCPNCRQVHNIPGSGTDGFPNNLTITALLDAPPAPPQVPPRRKSSGEFTFDPHSAKDKEEKETLHESDACTECLVKAHNGTCSHCNKTLCKRCKEQHKQSLQQDLTGDLHQIKQKISKLTTSLQGIKAGGEGVARASETTKRQIWETIEGFCKEMREQGNSMTSHLDIVLHQKLQNLRNQQERLELQVVRLESFHNHTSRKLKGPVTSMSDTELMDIRKQCSEYLGRTEPSLPTMAPTVKYKRRGSTSGKGKRQARSGNGTHSNKTTIYRPQSSPELQDGPRIQSSDVSPPVLSITEEPRTRPSTEQTIPKVLSLPGRLSEQEDMNIEEPAEPSAPFPPMETANQETSQQNDTQIDLMDTTYSGKTINMEQTSDCQDYTIVVKAIVGKRGSRFWNPSSLCISPLNGTIIAVDCYKNCAQILDKDGHFVTSFGSSGSGDGKFDYPSSCTSTADGSLFITDAFNHRVQVFNKFGTFQQKFGSLGSEDGHLEAPSGVAVDRNGYIYIADTNNYRIQVYDSQGGYVHTFGTPNSLPPYLQRPRYSFMTISKNGDVFVSDSKNHCVHNFSYTGLYNKTIGKHGSGLGEFNSPRGIALDQHGHVLVADRDNHRVQVFQTSGEFMYAFGSQGERAGQFQGPEGLALADNGDIVVAECGGQRVQIFSRVPFL